MNRDLLDDGWEPTETGGLKYRCTMRFSIPWQPYPRRKAIVDLLRSLLRRRWSAAKYHWKVLKLGKASPFHGMVYGWTPR